MSGSQCKVQSATEKRLGQSEEAEMPNHQHKSELETRWFDEEVPIINGIAFASGRVAWINHEQDETPGRPPFALEAGPALTLDELADDPDFGWTSVVVNLEVQSADGRWSAAGGEGGMGGDGFLAVFQGAFETLLWVAFFEDINPFHRLRFSEDTLTATTSLDYEWHFPLDAPEKVTVRHQAPN